MFIGKSATSIIWKIIEYLKQHGYKKKDMPWELFAGESSQQYLLRMRRIVPNNITFCYIYNENLTVISGLDPKWKVCKKPQSGSLLYNAAVGHFAESQREHYVFLSMEKQPSTRYDDPNIYFMQNNQLHRDEKEKKLENLPE